MIDQFTIRALAPQEARGLVGALSDVLIDCVEGGASVSFMLPLTGTGPMRSGMASPRARLRASASCSWRRIGRADKWWAPCRSS